MKATTTCVTVVWLVVGNMLMGAPALKDKPIPQNLHGDWEIESTERDGKVTPVTASPTRYRMNQDGTYETFRGRMQMTERRGFTFVPTAVPPALDLNTPPAGPEAPRLLTIYRVDGDQLTICIAGPKTPRPTEFVTLPEADVHIARFRRVKPKD